MINRIKQIGLVISFISITLFLIFIAQQFVKEVDNSSLRVLGFGFWIFFCGLNGYAHGKLINNLN